METVNQNVSNITDNLHNIRRSAGTIATELKGEAQARLTDARGRARARLDDGKARALDLAGSVHAFATEHPVAAFGAGIVAGLLLARRFRRKVRIA